MLSMRSTNSSDAITALASQLFTMVTIAESLIEIFNGTTTIEVQIIPRIDSIISLEFLVIKTILSPEFKFSFSNE